MVIVVVVTATGSGGGQRRTAGYHLRNVTIMLRTLG
jgi:hypothetical protein